MKTIIVLSLFVCLLACNTPTSVRSFIPGTYARYSESEYSKAWDTLRISLYDANSNTYVVQKQVGFQRILEGKLQPKQYKAERIMTVFDPSTGQLQDLQSGKLFVFSSEKKTVLMAAAEYHKVE